MALLTKLLDGLWNLRFLMGYRTVVAQWSLGVLSAYQGIATSPDALKANIHLPAVPAAIFVGLMAYFAGKVAQFAKEHTTPTP